MGYHINIYIGVCGFFLLNVLYLYRKSGGGLMNEFEQNVQSKTNDVSDSIMGFVVSFGFFATMFIIAVVVELIGR